MRVISTIRAVYARRLLTCSKRLLYRAGAAPHRVVGQMECELNDAMHARTCLPHPWHYAAAACEAKSDDSGLGYTATLAG